ALDALLALWKLRHTLHLFPTVYPNGGAAVIAVEYPGIMTAGDGTTARLTSIDAFRGFVMFLMLAEAMRLWTLHAAYPASGVWAFVAFQTTHVPWQGCSV